MLTRRDLLVAAPGIAAALGTTDTTPLLSIPSRFGAPPDDDDTVPPPRAYSCAGVNTARMGEAVIVEGIVPHHRFRPTKSGSRMAWATLQDSSGSIGLICFPGRTSPPRIRPGVDDWEAFLKSDQPIKVTGRGQRHDDAAPEILVDAIQAAAK